MNEVQDHYERIGQDYDRLFSFMDSYAEEQTADIIKWLQLEKTCILADIAGGTGKWSSDIYNKVNLENNVILQDPSPAMVSAASCRKGITVFCEDVHAFLNKDGLDFHKCFIRASIHHIANLGRFFTELYKIPSLSKVLVITRKPKDGVSAPMFKKALKTTHGHKLKEVQGDIIVAAKDAGFQVEEITKIYQVKVAKEEWLESIGNRMSSKLETLSDDDIKEGQAEIRKNHPEDVLSFENVFNNYILTKC